MTTIQLGLGIEKIHLARPAVLEKTDDGLRFGRMMPRARRERIRRCVAERAFLRQEVSQRQRANAACRRSQESAAGPAQIRRADLPHSTSQKALPASTIRSHAGQ